MEEKKVTEIDDAQVEGINGGFFGAYCGHGITTAFGKCSNYTPGQNFFNKKVMAIKGTCGACVHMMNIDGWHVCDLPYKE